mmetsp:Transcript_39050/g.75738  ORF Transcript_39050/g.75738 Transcript_39050/m.75738 type:complete len:292 (+) Transcript_39050:37-912(+)
MNTCSYFLSLPTIRNVAFEEKYFAFASRTRSARLFLFTSSIPCTGVIAKLDCVPDTFLVVLPGTIRLSCAFVLRANLFFNFWLSSTFTRSCPVPETPIIPKSCPVYSSVICAFPNTILFFCFISSVIFIRSRCFLYRFPPRLLRGLSMGTGRAFFALGGGGSCHFSIFLTICSRSFTPSALLLWLVVMYESILAARAHLAARSLIARCFKSIGVVNIISVSARMPWCMLAAEFANPPRMLRFTPKTCMLHDGISDSSFNPPATPKILAAISEPMIAVKFGAMRFILLSTYE